MAKKAAKKPEKQKRPLAKKSDKTADSHRKAFDQLLDDAIFGVEKRK